MSNDIDIDLVCTHEDLIGELGSEVELRRRLPAQPSNESDPTRPFREKALSDVLKLLRNRTPPIFPYNISDPSQLQDAVIYGTLARIFRIGITADADVHGTLWRYWEKRCNAETLDLQIDVGDGGTVPATSMKVTRG